MLMVHFCVEKSSANYVVRDEYHFMYELTGTGNLSLGGDLRGLNVEQFGAPHEALQGSSRSRLLNTGY
jgi:hypothetical protein